MKNERKIRGKKEREIKARKERRNRLEQPKQVVTTGIPQATQGMEMKCFPGQGQGWAVQGHVNFVVRD